MTTSRRDSVSSGLHIDTLCNTKIFLNQIKIEVQIEESTPITKNTPDFFKLTKQNLKTRETSFLIRQYGVQSPHQTKVVLPMFLKQE